MFLLINSTLMVEVITGINIKISNMKTTWNLGSGGIKVILILRKNLSLMLNLLMIESKLEFGKT